jgi:hypothetical protein
MVLPQLHQVPWVARRSPIIHLLKGPQAGYILPKGVTSKELALISALPWKVMSNDSGNRLEVLVEDVIPCLLAGTGNISIPGILTPS